MSNSLSSSPSGRQPAAADQSESDRSASADLDLQAWRSAMKDTGWTPDALAAHWDVDRGYAWKVMNGEKPLSRERALTFPDDMARAYHALKARAHGLTVVQPLTLQEALPALLGGIVAFSAVFASASLPERADRMARATLDSSSTERGVDRRRA